MTERVFIDKDLYNKHSFLPMLFGKDTCILIIKYSEITNPADFYKRINANTRELPFIIDMDIDPSEDQINWLIRFSFSPSYYKNDSEFTLMISAENKKLNDSLLLQGYTSINLLNKSLLSAFHFGKLFGYVHVNDKQGLRDLLITGFVEKDMGTTNVGIDDLLGRIELYHQLKILSAEKKDLETQVINLSQELENHKKYLDIALRQKETEHILDFYHKQYEVLPLWYKKIGHLIKIILGRRKIKSL